VHVESQMTIPMLASLLDQKAGDVVGSAMTLIQSLGEDLGLLR